jgi:hypothetical protein
MRRGRRRLSALLGIPLAAATLLAGCGSDDSPTTIVSMSIPQTRPEPPAAHPAPHGEPGGKAAPPAPGQTVPTLERRPRTGPAFEIARLRGGARVALLSAPHGRLIRMLSARTRFGSPQTLAVVRARGRWLGVDSPDVPNGSIGWVRFERAAMHRYWTRYSIWVDLASRTLTVRYGRHPQGSYPVTVGAAKTATPPGRFAITDALTYHDSPFYGCCALALSGHQEHLPPGWLAGNRIAIHGTPGPVGRAASAGCIRATDATMMALFNSVPLGTPVIVRR